jgi:hypothetical protein
MGLSLFKPSGGTSNPQPPNPNPKNFKILAVTSITYKMPITVLEVHYPGCTTLEGNKILVFKEHARRFMDEMKLPDLDPHFTETNNLIARFPATDEGLGDAIAFATWKSEQ